MSNNNKVVWTEGLFLRPQHFQQERRYLEHYVEERCGSIQPYGWGFTSLELDRELLSIGKIGIAKAEGVFPDGTPFVLPVDDVSPTPIDIDDQTKNQQVFLCIPVRVVGEQALVFEARPGQHTRYAIRELETRDEASDQATNTALMQVAGIFPELRLSSQVLDGYTVLGIAHVVEARVDRQVVLDDSYIPPTLNCRSSRRLDGLVSEVKGLLTHRADELARRVALSGGGGSAEVSDFLLLQTVNRYDPVVSHFASAHGLHPRTVYQTLLEIAGELATFVRDEKRPNEFPPYDHDDLRATFDSVMADIRSALSMVLEQRAVPIPIEEHRPGRLYSAQVADLLLLDHANFVLAAAADLSTEQIRQTLPGLIKLAAREELQEIVQKLLPGIPLRALPVAPRQIPFHAGNVYFELDSRATLWRGLKKTGGFGIHVGKEFPGLKLELWAIRG